jgi:DNA-binding NtrC family response regulator
VLSEADEEASFIRLTEAGASDFISLPLRRSEVLARVSRWAGPLSEIGFAVETMTAEVGLEQIIGENPKIRVEIEKVRRYAKCDAAVLISGETGTGKEVFARAVHYTGPRAPHPFLPVNCAALPSELVENELFGHEPGAFTGASRVHRGLIQQAEGGTLFLDEIDSLPVPMQAKFLRFLQEREYRPLGASRDRRADVRIISASNGDLSAAVRAGQFRQDLYFRLNVLSLNLPPLRERRDDIPLLANHLLLKHRISLTLPPASFSSAAIRKLMNHDWPGNVRELENVVERALVLSEGKTVEDRDVDLPVPHSAFEGESFKAQKLRVVSAFERDYLQNAMARHGGNITHAAKFANKNRRAFFALLKKHNLIGVAEVHSLPVTANRA